MADVKISQLPAVTSVATTDVIPVVTGGVTSKIDSANFVNSGLSGGTANGVLYLNGSKAATSGSALTFDGTNFTITSGDINIRSGGSTRNLTMGPTGAGLQYNVDGTFYINSRTDGYSTAFKIGGTEQMRLTSTGLEVKQSQLIGYSSYAGIGTNGLAVAGNVGIGTSSPSSALDIGKSGGIVLIGTKTASSTGSGLTGYRDDTGTTRYYTGILQQAANTRYSIYDNVNSAERLVVDASGNVGIGSSGFSGSPKLATIGSGDQEIQFTHSDSVYGRTVTLRLTNANGGYYTYGPYMQSILGVGLNSYTGLAFGINTLERMRLSSDGTFRVKGAGTAGSTDAVQFSGSAPASSMSLDSYGNLHIPGAGGIATNEAFGTGCLRSNTTGIQNTAIGNNALFYNTTGSYNTASGVGALQKNLTGSYNTASGRDALFYNTTGSNNTASGFQALQSNVTGNSNTASGMYALLNSGKTVTAGSFVVGVAYTIQSIGTTDFTLIGAASNTVGLTFTTTGVGTGTGTASSNTDNNSAFGYQALYANTTGNNSTASGTYALYSNTTGYSNTASGYQALYSNTTGYSNTAIGKNALYYNTTGSGNVMLGGLNSAGTYAPVFNPTTENDRFCMGSTSVTNAYIQVSWTVVSDLRDKLLLGDVPHGLDFVTKLKPIKYQFKESRDSDIGHGPIKYGFGAQDVLALEGDDAVIVDTEVEDKLKITDSHLVPVLVKAIQELKAELDELKSQLGK